MREDNSLMNLANLASTLHQTNPHLQMFKLPDVLFHLKIPLAKRDNLEVDLLFKGA